MLWWMGRFTKESLERLKGSIDLVELLSSHLEMKRAGGSYKALCPFHQEKSPSFVVQRGDSHYHCFGCGAHGDAITFLMELQKMSFVDAVESLAHRFSVSLEKEEGGHQGPDRSRLKDLLQRASAFYHAQLLENPEPLRYLEARGIDRAFIERFQVGWAPPTDVIAAALQATPAQLQEVGLFSSRGRDFFQERILFPICDASGAVVGFSGRKIREEVFGGKYINTPETPLFRKSRLLYGLNYCRRRIAKERRALIVEGQIDALRLIHAGLDIAVAGQGTAFGEGQVKELLQLGVRQVLLAFDADRAGQEAALKVGDLFQREGVEARVLTLPPETDPDAILSEGGLPAIESYIESSSDYLTFLVGQLSGEHNVHSPAGKGEVVRLAKERIARWSDRVMAHESLKRLAHQLQLPPDVVGITDVRPSPNQTRRSVAARALAIDPDQILEADLLRWLIHMGENEEYSELAAAYLSGEQFRTPALRTLFETYVSRWQMGEPLDPLSLSIATGAPELISEILERRVQREKGERLFPAVVQRLLDREWMEERERITERMQSGASSDEEALELARQFDALKNRRPEVVWSSS